MGRTHGWAGEPPGSNQEAIGRILAATRACIDRDGPRVSMTDVAEELGVTSQTVYRYFASTEALLRATSFEATGGFLDRLAHHVAHFDDPVDAVVEGMVFTVERLPQEPPPGPPAQVRTGRRVRARRELGYGENDQPGHARPLRRRVARPRGLRANDRRTCRMDAGRPPIAARRPRPPIAPWRGTPPVP